MIAEAHVGTNPWEGSFGGPRPVRPEARPRAGVDADDETPGECLRMPNPYANFRFRVKWDGTDIAGVNTVSGLTRTAQTMVHRADSDPATRTLQPGLHGYGPLTLENGVTQDVAFVQWASQAWATVPATGGGTASPVTPAITDHRKDITIEMFDEAGQKVSAYTVFRCWASEWEALREVGVPGTAMAIRALTLQHDGWVQDRSMAPPTEENLTSPTP